jgi:membrane protease YdiL (CAAX protease family)
MLPYAVVWGIGFLLVALFEETFLRGYLQYTLTRGLSVLYRPFFTSQRANASGFWTAAHVLCSVFGFGHSRNLGESPFGLVAVGLFGLTFIFSLWRTSSLWWAIGAHTSWNWAQSFLYGVGRHVAALEMACRVTIRRRERPSVRPDIPTF